MRDERVTWVSCPRCGDHAAVGWQITIGPDEAPREDVMSFTCAVGCTLTHRQLLHWFRDRHAGPVPGDAHRAPAEGHRGPQDAGERGGNDRPGPDPEDR